MNKQVNVKKLATAAILLAITFIMGVTPLGFINIPPIAITLMCLPVVIGALLEGWGVGMLLGLVFGITSFMMPSPLKDMMLAANPLGTLAVIFLPRLLIPITAFFVNRAFGKKAGTPLAVGVSAVSGSLTNTIGFLGLLYVLFAATLSDTVAAVLTAALGFNALLEVVVAPVVVVPVVLAVQKAVKK